MRLIHGDDVTNGFASGARETQGAGLVWTVALIGLAFGFINRPAKVPGVGEAERVGPLPRPELRDRPQ